MELTQEYLKSVLDYNPATGLFVHKVSRGRASAGSVAGSVNNYGYTRIGVCGADYLAHRLAWMYAHGSWPVRELDHINRIRTDNRLVNLREATCSENQQNRQKAANNRSGYVGVSWSKANRKWRAAIKHNQRSIYIGYFATPDAAHAAYLEAKARYHTFQPI